MKGAKEGSNQTGQSIAGDLPPILADDEFYQALASKHRRRVLHYLSEVERTTVEELATVLSGWEATETGTMQLPADRERIQLALVHNHLPRLADAGLIAYESHTAPVQLESLHPRVMEIIRQSVEAEQPNDS